MKYISRIRSFVIGVTMRNKKSKSEEVPNDRVERPMSWEGELSDSDMKQVRNQDSVILRYSPYFIIIIYFY